MSLYVWAQIAGVLSLIAVLISYLLNNRNQYLIAQIIANVLYGLQYLLLGGMTGFVTCFIAIARTVTFYIVDRKGKKATLLLLLLFEGLMVLSGILNYAGLISLIPVAIGCLYTWATWQPSYKVICVVGTIVGLMWCIYNFSIGAYAAILNGLVETTAGVIGLIKQIRADKHRVRSTGGDNYVS